MSRTSSGCANSKWEPSAPADRPLAELQRLGSEAERRGDRPYRSANASLGELERGHEVQLQNPVLIRPIRDRDEHEETAGQLRQERLNDGIVLETRSHLGDGVLAFRLASSLV
jgi:hypothetical protein